MPNDIILKKKYNINEDLNDFTVVITIRGVRQLGEMVVGQLAVITDPSSKFTEVSALLHSSQ